MDKPVVFEVEHTNEYGTFASTGEFSLELALQFANTLFTLRNKDGSPCWGNVTEVKITRTDRPLDTRTLEEIERNSIA